MTLREFLAHVEHIGLPCRFVNKRGEMRTVTHLHEDEVTVTDWPARESVIKLKSFLAWTRGDYTFRGLAYKSMHVNEITEGRPT